MSDTPQLNLPPDLEAVQEADGSLTVRKRADTVLSKVISFRTTTEEQNRLLPLVETFPERTWSAAMKWLLGHPGVQEIVRARVDSSVTPA